MEAEKDYLIGAGRIAAQFKVSRWSVMRWKKRGAPIVQVGKNLLADTGELWSWLAKHEKRSLPKNMSRKK
ncbi:MAG: hypothetical protein LBR82_00195 [Desulfovibrio sp.]|jgi:phage terminase Nu1 subunit (DNA packaging protein)|nr:hypothetical protein [Desulfovibrio sp.]